MIQRFAHFEGSRGARSVRSICKLLRSAPIMLMRRRSARCTRKKENPDAPPIAIYESSLRKFPGFLWSLETCGPPAACQFQPAPGSVTLNTPVRYGPYAVNLTRSTVAAAGVKIIASLIKTPTADHSTALLARPFWRQYTLPKEVTPWD